MSANKATHPYHIVELSPLPLLTAFSLLLLAGGGVMMMHKFRFAHVVFPLGIIGTVTCLYLWWRGVIHEGLKENHHTLPVRQGMRIGMSLFILSELMFFVGIFISFFKARLDPAGITDGLWVISSGVWPPKGILPVDAWDIPFMNTITLLLSGTTITWAHYALEENNQKDLVTGIGLTILLGVFFSLLQFYEYFHADFSHSSGVYGANFYLATGFHGLHVIIGTIFLIVCYFRAKRGDFAPANGHLGFEFAAWYWHFVDVVWLFLFVFVYVLGD